MKSYRKTVLTYAMAAVFVLFFYTFSFASGENIKGVQFKDGSIVYGSIVEMDANKVIIVTGDNQVITRKYNDIASFLQEDVFTRKKYSTTFGTEISYIEYKEPDIMKEKGMMYGLVFSYAYHNQLMLKAEGKIAYGLVDYDGATWGGTPLKISNISDYMLELRWLAGWDFVIKNSIVITPNIGIGYRYLQDNSQDKYEGGYQRESNYLYIPIGVETLADLGQGWFLGAKAEFDFFCWGRQISYMKDPVYTYDYENEQLRGYGARGSISIEKKGEKYGFLVEPYIKFWNIKESDYAYVTYGGYVVGYTYEPNNESTEIGCRVAVTF